MDVKKSFSLFVLLLALLLAACLKDDVKPSNGIEFVRIGEQVWMAKNMDTDVSGSFCYKGDSLNCKKYGRLYTWDAAQKVCPDGWRLPTENDFRQLREYARGADEKNIASVLKSPEWDSLGRKNGFNALPGGYRSELYELGLYGPTYYDISIPRYLYLSFDAFKKNGLSIWDSLFYFAKGENAFFWSVANKDINDSVENSGGGVWYLHKDGDGFYYSSLWKDHIRKKYYDKWENFVWDVDRERTESHVDVWYKMAMHALAFPVRCIKDLPEQKGLEPSKQDEDEKALITKWLDETQLDYYTRCNEEWACENGLFCGSLKRCQKFCMDPKDSSYVMLTGYQIFKGNPRKEFKEIFQFDFEEYDGGITWVSSENIACTESGYSIEMIVGFLREKVYTIDIDQDGNVSSSPQIKGCLQLYDMESHKLKKVGDHCNEVYSSFPRDEFYRFVHNRTSIQD